MLNNTNKIHIKDDEQFNPANYPKAISELAALRSGISETSIYFKVEIVISYLKHHSLQSVWIEANPTLARMITSGFFKTSYLESLFKSGHNNKTFIKGFEKYLSQQLLVGKN